MVKQSVYRLTFIKLNIAFLYVHVSTPWYLFYAQAELQAETRHEMFKLCVINRYRVKPP